MVAVDSCLSIFSTSCSEVTPLLFPHSVNTFSFSPCGRFLLAGLQNGSMQFVYLPFKKVLTGQPLAQSSDDLACFASFFFTGDSEKAIMVLVTNTRQIFTFNNVQLNFFHKALTAGDLESLKGAQAKIGTNITHTTIRTVNSCVTVIFLPQRKSSLGGRGY